jgi:hypothetical protein
MLFNGRVLGVAMHVLRPPSATIADCRFWILDWIQWGHDYSIEEGDPLLMTIPTVPPRILADAGCDRIC